MLEEEMFAAANNLEFEIAALLRDQVRELKHQFSQITGPAKAFTGKAVSAANRRKRKRRK